MTAMAPYLKLDHIDKTFRRGSAETEVLKDVTLAIEKGGDIFDKACPWRALFDASGRELPGGHSNDAPGLQTDARLTYTFKNTGLPAGGSQTIGSVTIVQ